MITVEKIVSIGEDVIIVRDTALDEPGYDRDDDLETIEADDDDRGMIIERT
jgi:hypothetical protein